MRAKVLLLATTGILLVALGWWVVGRVFAVGEEPLLPPAYSVSEGWPWEPGTTLTSESLSIQEGERRVLRAIPWLGELMARGPMTEVWSHISAPFRVLFAQPVSMVSLAYLLLCGLWAMLVWGFFGGAITRIAALDLARGQPLSLFAAGNFARKYLGSYFFGPLMPAIGTFFLLVIFILLSILMRLDFFLMLGGLLWFVLLLAGVLLAILLLGVLFGWPLMWPTISTEATDSFDALSRSYAYVYQRPLYYLWCIFVASVLGFLALLGVQIFAGTVLHIADLAAAWGAGAERMSEVAAVAAGEQDAGPMAEAGAAMISFWKGLVAAIVAAFQFGFFWCASTAIYLVLRRDVDHTEMDQVFLEEEEALQGLPELDTDDAGVPRAPRDPAAPPATESTESEKTESSSEPQPEAADRQDG